MRRRALEPGATGRTGLPAPSRRARDTWRVRRPGLAALCALTLALTVPAAGATASRHAARADAGRFSVVYAQGRTADEKFLIKLIKASQLSQVAAALSKSLILPANVTIAITRGQQGPYFDPRTKTINFNLPFAALMFRVITSEYPKISGYNLGVAFASLQYFILFHEIGHALINLWHIPVLGREEDAVDAFSTIFMTQVRPGRPDRALGRRLLQRDLDRAEVRRGRVRRRALAEPAAGLLDRLLGLRLEREEVRVPLEGDPARAARALPRRVQAARGRLAPVPEAARARVARRHSTPHLAAERNHWLPPNRCPFASQIR